MSVKSKLKMTALCHKCGKQDFNITHINFGTETCEVVLVCPVCGHPKTIITTPDNWFEFCTKPGTLKTLPSPKSKGKKG